MSITVDSMENLDNADTPFASDKNLYVKAYRAKSQEKSTQSEAILQHISSTLFATVLEEIIISIRLLHDTNNTTKIETIMIDKEMYLRKKYGVNMAPDDGMDDIGSRNPNSYEFKVVKMNRDREVIIDVTVATYKELTLRRLYTPMIDKNQEIIARKKYYAILQTLTNRNKLRVKELRRHLRQLSIQNKSIMYETDVILDKLHKSINDTALTEETRGRYVDSWERARTEQHIKTVRLAEDVSGNSIRYYRNRLEKELIVHNEIDSLVNVTIIDTMNKIQTWMEKYEKDTENVDLKIQIKRNEYMDRLNTRINLEETIQLHTTQMWDWTEFKRKRAEAEKYISDMTRCAIMVQAWWRGILVRKQLGPFKVSKKKKGAKKK